MIQNQTTFIIGAGGSCPYGFPDSKKLRRTIINNFEKDYGTLIGQHFGNTSINRSDAKKEAKSFCEQFYTADTSIDLFLTRNKQWANLGRSAIAYYLLHAEKESKFSEKMTEEKELQNWYSILFDRLTNTILMPENISVFRNNPVNFITFNYDRSLEHFLYTRLMANFGNFENNRAIISEIVKEVANYFPVYHVYGAIGKLDWQTKEKNIVNYGQSIQFSDLETIRENIGIMHTSRATMQLPEIMEKLVQSKNLFFLGFSFTKENVDMLELPKIIKERKPNVYATCYGSVKKERDRIGRLIAPTLIGEQLYLEDTDCVGLLRNHLI